MTRKSDLQDREDLARKLRLALHDRGWNQSDLARAASLPRELISTYVRGASFPTARSLRRLADALQLKFEELAPQAPGMFQYEPAPTMAITGLANGKARITVNTVVPIGVALEIGRLIENALAREGVNLALGARFFTNPYGKARALPWTHQSPERAFA